LPRASVAKQIATENTEITEKSNGKRRVSLCVLCDLRG